MRRIIQMMPRPAERLAILPYSSASGNNATRRRQPKLLQTTLAIAQNALGFRCHASFPHDPGNRGHSMSAD